MKALVRGVPSSYAQATVRCAGGGEIDVARARAQHAAYVSALRGLGVEIVEIPVAEDLPDSCFVEDQAVVVGDRALLCRVGHPGRRAEQGPIAAALAANGVQVATMAEGTLDGGDVLRVGGRLFVGRSDRSDDSGAWALAERFGDVVTVEVGDRLHLKCVATALDERTVLVADESVDFGAFVRYARVLLVPAEEAYAANVVTVGRHALIAEGYPATRAILESEGFTVHPLATSEIAKGDGSLTCLSIVWGSPAR